MNPADLTNRIKFLHLCNQMAHDTIAEIEGRREVLNSQEQAARDRIAANNSELQLLEGKAFEVLKSMIKTVGV